ncbi:hypothetical protein JXB37_06250 [candidate division WOR-3 bacterium]|nr:hypothetical protein [candidate division WOR-3 bacterium]
MRTRLLLLSAVSVLAVLGAGCPSRATVARQSPARAVVEEFLTAMVEEDEDRMEELISPAWLEENDVDFWDYELNSYSPVDFKVTAVKGGLVTAEIEFEAGGAHRLVFETRKENGRWYIVPGSYDEPDWDWGDDGWVHPWKEIETDIR